MIQLGRSPIEGGSVVVRLSFRDLTGCNYEPVDGSVNFSLYAQNESGDTWVIVNNRKESPLTSESVVDIVLQGDDLALLSGCNTKRRVIINWSYLRNGEETIGREMVDFSIIPLPTMAA